jgi:hypothetical protein
MPLRIAAMSAQPISDADPESRRAALTGHAEGSATAERRQSFS